MQGSNVYHDAWDFTGSPKTEEAITKRQMMPAIYGRERFAQLLLQRPSLSTKKFRVISISPLHIIPITS